MMPAPNVGAADAAQSYCRNLSLADALDRILHRGVSLQGNLTIGLADVDLLYLDLRLLLGSVDALQPQGAPPIPPVRPQTPSSTPLQPQTPAPRSHAIGSRDVALDKGGSAPPMSANDHPSMNGSSTAQGLVRLVLTLVKLLHEVLERQAVRRMEAGRLTEAQIENLGMALFVQAEEILRLQRQFGLSDQDVSLELGVPDGAL